MGDTNTFRENQHNLYHIVLYTAGDGAFLMDRQAYPAEAGTVCITSPGQPHDFVSQLLHHGPMQENPIQETDTVCYRFISARYKMHEK